MAARVSFASSGPISEDATLDTQLQQQEAKLADLEDKGYKPLKQYQKFEKAGMLEEYSSTLAIFTGLKSF